LGTKARGKGTGDSTSSETQEKKLGEGPAEAKTTCAPTHRLQKTGLLQKPNPPLRTVTEGDQNL